MPTEPNARPTVILDPHFRRIDEIFEPHDLDRLHGFARVVWGQDGPIPSELLDEARSDAFAIVTARWRHGDPAAYPKLRAILEVGGRHPSPADLDYATCFARGIRVLSCAPAFGPMVAEMALALTLASARNIVDAHIDFRAGQEIFLHAGNVGTFTLFGQTVGFIGYGGLARQLRPLLAPFGCTIQVYDPWLPESYLREQGVEPVSLERLLETSRVIYVLAIPSAENRAMLDRAMLERIQATPFSSSSAAPMSSTLRPSRTCCLRTVSRPRSTSSRRNRRPSTTPSARPRASSSPPTAPDPCGKTCATSVAWS